MFAGGGDDVTISLTAVDNVTPILRQVSQGMGVFTGDATRMVSSLAQLGAAALPIMAIGGAFIYAGQQASMVQQNVANLNAVLHATSEQLAAIRNNGLALSQATQFTDAQILASQRQLAKGGATAADLAQPGSQGISGATLNLAAATQSDATAAATAMTTASSAFQIPVQDAAKTATTLASAVDSSVGSLSNQASALKQVGVVAKAAGLDLKDTVTSIADLQNNGMLNDSGTGLKTFLTRIEAPSATSKKVIDDLGLSFYDLQGKLKPIPELFDEIHTKLSGLDQQTANDALTKIFGVRGVRVADVALEQGSSGFIDTAQSMAEKGDAAEIAGRKLDTFQGSASKAASSLNVLAVQFGTVLLPGMKDFADMTEGAANRLSQLNNAAAVVPQIAVGIAAIAGIAKVGSFIDDRSDSRATAMASAQSDALRAIRAPAIARDLTQSQSTVKTETGIAAATANEQAALDEQEKQSTVEWGQINEKTDADIQASRNSLYADLTAMDDKYTSARMSNLAAQRAAVNELRATEAQRAADATALADIQMRQDAAALAIRQDFAHQRLDLSSRQATGENANPVEHYYLSQNQGLDTSQQQALQASKASFDSERQAMTAEASQRQVLATQAAGNAERDALKAAYQEAIATRSTMGAEEVDALMEANQKAIAASQEATDREVAAIRAGAAAKVDALKLANQETIAASQATYGTQMFGLGQTSAMQNVKITTGEVTADAGLIAGLKGKAGAVIGTAMAAVGEFIVPALIALTVVEMVIKPIDQAIVDRAVKNDSQLQNLTANVDSITADRGQSYADQVANTAQTKQDVQKEIDQKQAQLDAANKSRGGVPILGGIDQGVRGVLGIQPADLGALSKEIATLKDEYASLDQQTKKTDLMPEAALSKANDTLTTLLTQVDAGTLSVADFTSAWATAGKEVGEDTVDQLEKQGVAQDKANKLVRDGIDLAKQHAKALEDAKQQAEADYMASAQTAQTQLALGATPDMVDVANFSKHADQTDATKVEVANAKKSIEELKTAWTGAQQVINGIDISKGIDAFGKEADAIRTANQELQKVGQQNPALTELGRLSDMFNQVTDAETLAMRGLDGYNLTLQQTQGYSKQLSAAEQEFMTALDSAYKRQAQGRATAYDQELIAKSPNIHQTFANQQDQLSQNMVLDVLGTVKNLPDFAALDKYARSIIESFPGGQMNLVATITSDAKQARLDIENILKPPITVTVDVDISQFSPALIDSIKKYGGATQGGTYNDTGSSGGGTPPGAPPGTPPGGWGYKNLPSSPGYTPSPLGYADLSPDQYMSIVRQSEAGKSNGPFEDPAIRDALLGAAKSENVDPRLMLDFTKFENNDAININPELNMANNFGGIKYQKGLNQDSGIAADNGGTYARYDTPQEFFKALADNLKSGQYADLFNKGDVTGIRTEYVTGGAQPNYEQSQNIQNTTAQYWEWKQKFPAGASGGLGVGGVGVDGGGGGGGVASDTMIDGVAAGVRASIVQKALSQVDQAKMVGYCEQWVEETVQGITGKRGATGTNEATASTAFAHGQAMGLETKNPQPGDLVYYPDASGGTGHVAIYMGGGQQVSTADQGSMTGKDAQIHTEAVGANARYLSIGAGGINYGTGDPGNRGNATGGTALLGNPNFYTNGRVPAQSATGPVGTINAEQTPVGNDPTARTRADISGPSSTVTGLFSKMNSDDIQKTVTAFNSFGPILDKIENAKLPDWATPEQHIEASNTALQESVDLEGKYAAATDAISHGTGDIAQKIQAVRDAGGPIGQNLASQLVITEQIANVNDQIAKDKAAITAEDRAYQSLQDSRKAQDQQDQRTQQQQQWTDAANKRATDEADTKQQWQVADFRQAQTQYIDDQRTAQNDAWTERSRQLQDEQRLMDFNGTQRKAQLQQELVDLGKVELLQRSMFTTEEQMLQGRVSGGSVSGAGDRSSKQNAAELLAITKDYDRQTQLTAKNQTDNINAAMQAEDRLVAKERYDFETKQLVETRAHEDELRRLDQLQKSEDKINADADKQQQRKKQQDDWNLADTQAKDQENHQKSLWNIQDTRDAEDKSHQTTINNLNDDMTAQGELLKGLNADLTTLQNMETQWTNFLGKVTSDLQNPLSGVSVASGNRNPATVAPEGKTATNVPFDQFPQAGFGQGTASTGTIHTPTVKGYASGTESAEAGYHPVVEQGPELLFKGGERVMSNNELRSLILGGPPASAQASATGTQPINVNLNFESGLNGVFDAEAMARLRTLAQQEAARCLANQRTTNQSLASVGAARMVG